MGDFTHNHYVPEWYQHRFLQPGQGKYNYLDLSPEKIVTPSGHTYTRSALLKWGPKSCFAQDDLYTTQWGSLKNTEIERIFFGEIDSNGHKAVDFFDDYKIKDGMHEAFQNLVRYMSIQKLRTPKGLGFISNIFDINSTNKLLLFLQRIQYMYGAVWADAVWQIADASESPTKFIISDHPVTVYEYPVWFWHHWPWVGLKPHYPGERRAILHNTFATFFGRRLLTDFNCALDVAHVLEQKCLALEQHKTQMSSLLPEQGWLTLHDVAYGDWLACFFQKQEVYCRYPFPHNSSQPHMK